MKNIVKRIVIIIVRLLWSIGAIILWALPVNTVYFIITGKEEWSWWQEYVLLEKYDNLIHRFDDWINSTKE